MKKLLLVLVIPLLMGFSCSLFKSNKTEQASQDVNLEEAANLQNEKNSQELTLESLKEKLKNIKSVHFYETISYSENSSSTPQISESEGDLIYPYDFDYKMASMTTPLEDGALDNSGLAGVPYLYAGGQVKKIGDKIYSKPNMENLLAMNIVTEDEVSLFNEDEYFKEYFYNWREVTYDGLNYYPMQLADFWSLADIPTQVSKISDKEYSVELDNNILDNYFMQYFRVASPSDLSSLEYFQEEKNKGGNLDNSTSSMSIILNDNMDLDKIVIIRQAENVERVTTFSELNQIKEISPITEKIVDNPDVDLNFERFEVVESIYYNIEFLFEGKSYPKADNIVRLDDINNPIVQDIIEKSVDEMLKRYPYLNRDFEKNIFINIFTDPKPDKYYYGYQYIDDGHFRISFIQEASDPYRFSDESSICNIDFCINFFAGKSNNSFL